LAPASPRKDPDSLPESDPVSTRLHEVRQYCTESTPTNDKTGEGGKRPGTFRRLTAIAEMLALRLIDYEPPPTRLQGYGKKIAMTAFSVSA